MGTITKQGYFGTPPIVRDGLVLYLDAGSQQSYTNGSTIWNDLSGNGNNITLINSPTFNSTNGGSLVFNGTNQYGAGTDLDLDYITIDAWVFSTASGNNGYVVNKNFASNIVPYSLSLGSDAATAGMAFYPGTWYKSGVSTNIMNTNAWYNVVGTFDGTTLKYYLNNSLNASSTPAINILPKNNSVFDIGRYLNDNAYFGGRIAIVKIYNRAISEQELNQNYNELKTRYGLQ